MSAKSVILAAVFAISAVGFAHSADLPTKAPPPAAAAPETPFFLVNNNSISYRYEFTANNPGAGKTPKNVVSFTHFDVWEYGTNLFNVDWLKATNGAPPPNGAPAAPCDLTGTAGCPGYTEIYGLFRSSLGWNQLTHSKMFAVGPLTNIDFAVGMDANTDNTTLGSAKRSIQGGLKFDFMAPYDGSINVSVLAYKEWQHDGFASNGVGGTQNLGGKVDFNTTWAIEAAYSQPLGFLPASVPLSFGSALVVHGPKGCGEPCNPGPGLVRTTEILTQQTIDLDVGKMLGNKPGMLSVFAAYRWWKNKFGIDPNQPGFKFTNTIESTWLTGVKMAF